MGRAQGGRPSEPRAARPHSRSPDMAAGELWERSADCWLQPSSQEAPVLDTDVDDAPGLPCRARCLPRARGRARCCPCPANVDPSVRGPACRWEAVRCPACMPR
eukprot:7093600-Alexandrium_andersonii.AAC.1